MIYYLLFITLLLISFIIFKNNNSSEFTKLHDQLINKHKKNKYKNKILNIPIYYINLDKSKDRRKYMENQSKKYNIKFNRIDAIKYSDIINIKKGSLYFNNKQIKYYNKYIKENKKELACTLSHLKAIYTSYINGDNICLILEDDVSFALYPTWKNSLNNIIKDLPEDWKILNLSSYHYGINKLYKNKINKKFVPYYNFSLQTYAYIINRSGMENILYDILSNNTINLGFDISRDGNSLLADKLIYHRSLKTYIFTEYVLFIPYNNYEQMDSTINKGYTIIHINTYYDILKNLK